MSIRDAQDTVVLITGCSKGGMGYANAEEFARYGRCKVYATARKPERMAGLEELGCATLKLDITDEDNVKHVVDEILSREGHIDALVNNAGAAARGAVLDVPIDATKELFETNFYGQIRMIQAVAPHMVRQRYGVIMNVGSMASLWSFPFLLSYSATKAALQSVSDAARVELMPFNVHVVHVLSGWVRTNIFNNAAQGRIYCPPNSFYAPIKDFLESDIFHSIGMFPVDAHTVSRQLVRAALRRHPPALLYVGRWIWNTWFCAHFVPSWVLDLFAYYSQGLYKLAGTGPPQEWEQRQGRQGKQADGDAPQRTGANRTDKAWQQEEGRDTAAGRDQDNRATGVQQQDKGYVAGIAAHPAAGEHKTS